MKIMIALNTAWNLVNFRVGLMRALTDAGYEVVAVAPNDKYASKLDALGFRYVELAMNNQGTHPGRDFILFLRFLILLRREKPDAYLGYTAKPNIYGSLAANALGIPVINNIAGLGATFIKQSLVTKVIKTLYWAALKKSSKVFFQNEDDRNLFVTSGLVKAQITDLLPGSGINLNTFFLAPMPAKEKPVRFLLIARMLWDKGVGEYVEAARSLRRDYPDAEFCLLGFLDVLNPAAISSQQAEQWVAEGVIKYLGETHDVRPYIAESHCVVLPSYREGTPRSLLEAAAMGRPLVTTDAVGCREVVEHNVNGLLCEVRNADDLADKMRQIIKMSPEKLNEMGRLGRQKVEREFDEKIVIQKYLDVIDQIVNSPNYQKPAC